MAQIEFSVIDRRSGNVLLQKRFDRSAQAKTKPPQGFVNAMAENLKHLLGEATNQIADVVAQHWKRTGSHP